MGETGMVEGSGTSGRAIGLQQKVAVDVTRAGGNQVATGHTPKPGQMYVVRAAKGEQKVVVQVDTSRMSERNKIKAANDSVRRRTRG